MAQAQTTDQPFVHHRTGQSVTFYRKRETVCGRHRIAFGQPGRLQPQLSVTELPAGFAETGRELCTNEQAAHRLKRSAAQLEDDGRLLASRAEFRSSQHAVSHIMSEVVSYRTTAAARDGYRRTTAPQHREAALSRQGWSVAALDLTVGDECSAISATEQNEGFDMVLYLVHFLRDSYVTGVAAYGLAGQLDAGPVHPVDWLDHVRLARYS
jgi:hypothetical protein